MDKIQELEEFAQLLVITTENIIKEVGDEAHLEAFGNVIEFQASRCFSQNRIKFLSRQFFGKLLISIFHLIIHRLQYTIQSTYHNERQYHIPDFILSECIPQYIIGNLPYKSYVYFFICFHLSVMRFRFVFLITLQR